MHLIVPDAIYDSFIGRSQDPWLWNMTLNAEFVEEKGLNAGDV